MASVFGRKIRLSLFGQSRGECVGAVIDGLPAGEEIDPEALRAGMARRSPGRALTSPRKEGDEVRILSGLKGNVTCGAPLCLMIPNTDAKPDTYTARTPRPGHADWPASVRYRGNEDIRGGGHFSARLTAPLTAAGEILRQIYRRRGILFAGHIRAVGTVEDDAFDPAAVDKTELDRLSREMFPVLNEKKAGEMRALTRAAAEKGDSVGGRVECAVLGLPPGLGDPIFDGLESRVSAAVFAVPAVKAVSFGDAYAAARGRGSDFNDPYGIRDGKVTPLTNHAGGILGGLSTGMPLIVEAAFKPTPTIALPQRTVDLDTMTETVLRAAGRSDPCVVLRAVPCVEAAVALALADFVL